MGELLVKHPEERLQPPSTASNSHLIRLDNSFVQDRTNMADENYEGIDFEELNEITGLEKDEIKVLKSCFTLFDVKKQDFLSADDLDDILRAMGFRPSKEELKEILEEIDEDGSGEIEFGEFCQLCAKFLVEEPDEETMKAELKEAFRIYDKEGQGYITTGQLREI